MNIIFNPSNTVFVDTAGKSVTIPSTADTAVCNMRPHRSSRWSTGRITGLGGRSINKLSSLLIPPTFTGQIVEANDGSWTAYTLSNGLRLVAGGAVETTVSPPGSSSSF